MKYFKQLDGLRAIAVIGVMIAHWYEPHIKFEIIKNIPYGTGVSLFFVLSGFLITTIILNFKEKNASNNQSQ
jgi:peptidoglycan/LPS O-acetylase OafA/YrhL